jgi:hypothetical protein
MARIPLIEENDHPELAELIAKVRGGLQGRLPGVPPDRVAALRRAFQALLKDATFLDQAKKMELPIDPLSGLNASLARS